MADLAPRGPFEGFGLPLEAGRCRLAALPEVPRVAVAPFAGREAAVAACLGQPLPPPGGTSALGAGRIVWAGAGLWLVEGAAPAGLDEVAAVSDQTDAWARLALGGADAGAVLARLVPLDLDPGVFPAGRAARTLLRHVPLLLVAAGAGFELLVPRSCARTAVGDLAEAMRGVAARAQALTPPPARL